MWAGMLHLVFGNAVLGIAEGALLAMIFRLPLGRSIGLLVLANYFSAWAGSVFLRNAIVSHASLDIRNAWHFFWTMVVATYVITLLLELPFVIGAFCGKPKWLFKSLWGSLIVQTASYVLIFGWYWMVSGTSLYTKTELVELSAISLPEEILLFYISADDGDVYVRAGVVGPAEKAFDLDSSNRNDRLLLQDAPIHDDQEWELVARLETTDVGDPELISMGRSFPEDTIPEPDSRSEPVSTWLNFGRVSKLGRARSSEWRFETGFWPIEGLCAERMDVSDSRVGFSYETPFGQWYVRNAVHLPSDQVLFQLGDDQICVYDPETRRIALVTKGRGPIAVLKEELPSMTDPTE